MKALDTWSDAGGRGLLLLPALIPALSLFRLSPGIAAKRTPVSFTQPRPSPPLLNSMSYSNTSGGTLTLPSPTPVHHVDVGSAVRSLRRSLSRSPSKFNLARPASQGPEDLPPLPAMPPQTPCPQTSQNVGTTAPNLFSSTNTPQQPTPFATPFRPSLKLSLRSARPKATSKPATRPRPSPKSPLKRALSITSDSGNSTPSTTTVSEPLLGQENNSAFSGFALAFGVPSLAGLDKPSRHSMHLDLSGASKNGNPSRFLDTGRDAMSSSTLSPLKRSDAIMDSDQNGFVSPVAKRRSLHGISSLASDSSIFDHVSSPQTGFDIHEDNFLEYQLSASLPPTQRDSVPSPTPQLAQPRRSSSLRKSTLQQRHDPRSSWGRRQGEKYLAQQSSEASTPPHRNRPRASLDQILRPEPRESPFTARGPLPNPSSHAVDRAAHQPHPLSRSLTTSSSGSSIPDESPTHFPVQNPDRPRPGSMFGRSLPLGAQRPREAVATPQYKSAIPFQAAFASTGLVSKMNRNPEQDPAQRGGRQMIMPDTPCKKQVYPSNTYPPSSGSGRKQQHRFAFPAPETPFTTAAPQARGTFGTSDKMGGLFKLRTGAGHARKSSLLSLDGDSAEAQGVEGDLPPTPTKSVALARNLSGGMLAHATPVATRTVPPSDFSHRSRYRPQRV